MESLQDVFYDKVSPSIINVLKFLLIQDPVKVAIGLALGMSLNNLFVGFSDDMIKPLVSIFSKSVSDTGLKFFAFGSTFNIGDLFQQIVTFIVFILCVYYLFVVPVNKLKQKYDIDQKTTSCPYCTTLINPNATRCPACTSNLNKN